MHVKKTPLVDLLVIEPKVSVDFRGRFIESYQIERYSAFGIPHKFVQDNLSQSMNGVLRGLHFQYPKSQGKLVYVPVGEIFDVAVDLRPSSTTFKKWFGLNLSSDNHRQVYVPPGFAHGFCVLSQSAHVIYKCTEYYQPNFEHTIRWNDPEIGIRWPIRNPVLSQRDKDAPSLSELDFLTMPIGLSTQNDFSS